MDNQLEEQIKERRKMASLIVNHLKAQLTDKIFCDDAIESMEVAVQCLESAYNLEATESDHVDVTLANIVKNYYEENGYKVK